MSEAKILQPGLGSAAGWREVAKRHREPHQQPQPGRPAAYGRHPRPLQPQDRTRPADDASDLPQPAAHRGRLRRCLIMAGAENLPDDDLLEVILFTAHPRAQAEPLVAELLDRFGSLAEVLSADPEALAAAGLSEPAIAGIKLVREVALRLIWAELRERPVIDGWDRLIDYCRVQIGYSVVEEFHLLFLDRKNILIRHERQQRGTVDHTPVYPREVVKRALELGASALILVHNHPSGDLTPSKADIAITQDIVKAASLFGVTVHDHVIIGRGGHTSLHDLGLIRAPGQAPIAGGARS